MRENENRPHHQPEIPSRDDGPPEGCEADWLKWRSRMNRRIRLREQALARREGGGLSNQEDRKLPGKADGVA